MDDTIDALIKADAAICCFIVNIEEDIDYLCQTHESLVQNSDRKSRFYNYGVFIDDIYFQKTVLSKELAMIKHIMFISRRKIYGDLYRLYLRIVRMLIDINHDYLDSNRISSNIISHLKGIKIFRELRNTDEYTVSDIVTITHRIEDKLETLKTYISEIIRLVEIHEQKKADGFSVNMLLIGLQSERTNMESKLSIFTELLNGILSTASNLFNKYARRSEEISLEVSDSYQKAKNSLSILIMENEEKKTENSTDEKE